MHTIYRTTLMRQLRDQQVRFAPRDKKIEQVERAERLLEEIDPERTYTYEYICYRITQYRPEARPDQQIVGEDAQHDLRWFIEDVSDSIDLDVKEVAEPVYTVDDLSKMFNVSTKTISRWRQRGLVSRRFSFAGRKRVGFLASSVNRYLTEHEEEVKRGGQFTQLTDQERGEIIRRARRLARAGGCPSEVTRRIARRMNRSVETIRYTLRQFDEKHPDLAVFPDHRGPMTEDVKRRIYQQHRRGHSIEALAHRHCRTKTTIHRVINEMRAARLQELPLDHIHHETFDDPRHEASILGPLPDADAPARRTRMPAGLPPYLAALYDVPLLDRQQEMHLFRKYNYLKYLAAQKRNQLDRQRPRASLLDDIERLYGEAIGVKNQIVRANLRLVVSIAKRHVTANEDFFGLVSDGNMSLIRAVEKFDFSRGNKFSTYASWAIMKNFARTIPDEYRYRDRFRTSHDEMFVGAEDARRSLYEQESAQRLRESQIDRILSRLDEREQQIIISRFGLDRGHEPLTLKEVGAAMGVTKERIRQIEARALSKLRLAVQEEQIELSE